MRKLWLAAGTLGLCAVSAFGQAARIVKVSVTGEPDSESTKVAELMKGKVGSTQRYALVTKGAEVLVIIACVPLSERNDNVACSHTIMYMPKDYHGMTELLTASVTTGPAEYDAQTLFNSMVEASTDEELDKMLQLITLTANDFKAEGYADGYTEGRKHCVPQNKPSN
jgi:hypothetical protein